MFKTGVIVLQHTCGCDHRYVVFHRAILVVTFWTDNFGNLGQLLNAMLVFLCLNPLLAVFNVVDGDDFNMYALLVRFLHLLL